MNMHVESFLFTPENEPVPIREGEGLLIGALGAQQGAVRSPLENWRPLLESRAPQSAVKPQQPVDGGLIARSASSKAPPVRT